MPTFPARAQAHVTQENRAAKVLFPKQPNTADGFSWFKKRTLTMMQHIEVILAVLLGVSESLALIPQVKANSIVQVVISILKKLAGK